MHISFNPNKVVGSLPGALIFGTVVHSNSAVVFCKDKSAVVPQRRLSDFMKILQCLSKNVILEEKDKSSSQSFSINWGKMDIAIDNRELQCQTANSSFAIIFDVSLCLSFLIAIRKVSFWMVAPTKSEYDTMDFFTRRTINNSAGFPKITQMEEDANAVLDAENDDDRKFYLTQFVMNHHALLEFQYNLYLLTTKK